MPFELNASGKLVWVDTHVQDGQLKKKRPKKASKTKKPFPKTKKPFPTILLTKSAKNMTANQKQAFWGQNQKRRGYEQYPQPYYDHILKTKDMSMMEKKAHCKKQGKILQNFGILKHTICMYPLSKKQVDALIPAERETYVTRDGKTRHVPTVENTLRRESEFVGADDVPIHDHFHPFQERQQRLERFRLLEAKRGTCELQGKVLNPYTQRCVSKK